MATTLYFKASTVETRAFHGTNRNKLDGSAGTWTQRGLMSTRGAGVTSVLVAPVTGPTNGVEFVSGITLEWISAPLAADVTISGTISFNLRAAEAAMTTNAAINCYIDRMDNQSAVQERVITTTNSTELGTSEAAVTINQAPGSGVAFNKGDRIRACVFIDDGGGTMASGGGSCTFWYAGTTGGASGDSFITFNETFTLDETTPAGTIIYPTNTASTVSTASVDREAWTSRGAGVQTDVTNTTAQWSNPVQLTDTAGGTVVDWFTKQLTAFTLSGPVLVNLRAKEDNASARVTGRCEIARVESDGTSPTVWGANTYTVEFSTTEAAYQFWVSGDDLSITNGQRLRIRIYIDDTGVGQQNGFTSTVYYAGTSGGASGDTYLQFTETLTEFTGGAATDAVPFRAIVIS